MTRTSRLLALSTGLFATSLVAGCEPPRSTSDNPIETADPTAIEAEVQRVFDDAMCFCESRVLPGVDVVRSADVAATSPSPRMAAYLTRFARSNIETPIACTALSDHAARQALAARPEAGTEYTDAPENACLNWGVGLGAAAHALCQSELDACVAQELRFAASSLTSPLDATVRELVLAEAAHRMTASAAQGLAELTRLRGSCAPGSVEPDCDRVARGYGRNLVQRVSDATSAGLSIHDDLMMSALSRADATSPAEVEAGSFGAAMFGPASARAAVLTALYGGSVVGTATVTPAFAPALIARTGQAVEAPLPTSLALNSASVESASMRVMRERENIALPTALTLGGVSYPAGTRVSSYLVHYDPPGTASLRAIATLQFDRPVLGVLSTDSELSSSQATFLAPGVTYFTAAGRGIEPGVAASSDSLSVYSHAVVASLSSSTSLDEFRIITAAAPEAAEEAVSSARGGDLPYATRLYGDLRVRRVVALLEEHQIALPHTSCVDAATGEVTSAAWTAAPDAEAVYAALEAALRSARGGTVPHTGPDLLAGLGIEVAEVAEAIEHIRDVQSTMDGVVLAPLPSAPTGTTCGSSRLRHWAPRVRSLLPVLAAIHRRGTGSLGAGGTFYTPSVSQLSSLGMAGAANLLRVNLAAARPTMTAPAFDAESVAATDDALALIDAELGPSWTEWRVCEGSNCEGDGVGVGRWSVYERTGTDVLPAGRAVLVSSMADAACLIAGREPLAPPSGTCGHITTSASRYVPMTSVAPSASDCVGPYCRRSFVTTGLRLAPSTSLRYVLWCATDAVGQCTSHRLVDAFYLGAGPQVHAFGGDTMARLEEAFLIEPENPAVPVYNVFGLRNDFVPPAEPHVLRRIDRRQLGDVPRRCRARR